MEERDFFQSHYWLIDLELTLHSWWRVMPAVWFVISSEWLPFPMVRRPEPPLQV
jgi:hypothetical protein